MVRILHSFGCWRQQKKVTRGLLITAHSQHVLNHPSIKILSNNLWPLDIIMVYIYIYIVDLKHCETVKTRYKYTVLSVFEAQRHFRSCRVAPSSVFVAVKKTRALSRKTRCARTTCTRPECVFCGPNTWLTDVVYSNERWWDMTMDSVFCLSQDSKLNTCRRFAWRFACFCII